MAIKLFRFLYAWPVVGILFGVASPAAGQWTRSPVQLTRCPVRETLCPAVATRCPVNLTSCPPATTRCPVQQTACPPVSTACPPETTRCPIKATVCPPATTRCPAVQTLCPEVSTKCPVRQTSCPPSTTRCPSVATKCPARQTVCPVVLTRCPPGDMVVGQYRDPGVPNSHGPGSILTVDTATGKVFTLASRFTTPGTTTLGPCRIEMASDNMNFTVGSLARGTAPTEQGRGAFLHSVGVDGSILGTLIADTTPGVDRIHSFDLDGDGTWIVNGTHRLWAFDENTMVFKTLWSTLPASGVTLTTMALDPALPRGSLVLGNAGSPQIGVPKLFEADRTRLISTISSTGPFSVTGVKVDYKTGDYLCSALGPGPGGTGGEFSRTTKGGMYRVLNNGVTTLYNPSAIHIDKQHLVWMLTTDVRAVSMPPANPAALVCSLYKVDQKGIFITLFRYSSTLTLANFAPSGLTRYGSRNVVCNGTGRPGTTVKISFTSRKAADAGRPYQLAASFGYRNGVKCPNGEFLDLTLDDLFLVTSQNLLPMIFDKFAGVLDASGEATAAVRIPGWLPPGPGIPIFVSGIVIDPGAPGGVTTVGNTHWFTLR